MGLSSSVSCIEGVPHGRSAKASTEIKIVELSAEVLTSSASLARPTATSLSLAASSCRQQ